MPKQKLRTLQDIINYLHGSKQSIFYVSRSATNLLGVDRWISGLHYVTLIDSWDGQHERAFTPRTPLLPPRGNIQVVKWLLRNREVQAYIAKNTPPGIRPQIAAVMFDSETEQLCDRLGYELIMPSLALRDRIDSKLVTTRLASEAGVQSAPNVLAQVSSWQDLRRVADSAGLGDRLVIQEAYGNSGHTTYFIECETDFRRHESAITGREVKIMRHIEHITLAAESVITRGGVVTGPIMRELTGYKQLTGYPGAWVGSEIYADVLPETLELRIRDMMRRFCERLAREGYRGTLDISILYDEKAGEVFLGELNPRISGSSPHSNLAPGRETLPLFAFHALEYSGVDFELPLAEIARARRDALGGEPWCGMIIQFLGSGTETVQHAPPTGFYRIQAVGDTRNPKNSVSTNAASAETGANVEGASRVSLEYRGQKEGSWHTLAGGDELFWFSASSNGGERTEGQDLGTVMVRRRLQNADHSLTPFALEVISAVQSLYRARPLPVWRLYARAGLRRLHAFFFRS